MLLLVIKKVLGGKRSTFQEAPTLELVYKMSWDIQKIELLKHKMFIQYTYKRDPILVNGSHHILNPLKFVPYTLTC